MGRDAAGRMLEDLQRAGLKLTPQRRAIVQALAGDESHPTAQEIFDRLKVRQPGLSFATVYNTLSALSSVGRVQRISLDGSATRFDPNVQPHHHAVCERCGAVRDVPASGLERDVPASGLERDVPASGLDRDVPASGLERTPRQTIEGFEIHRVEMVYRGLCRQCVGAASE